MAITKTHPIKSTLKAAIDYICNPEKTDGKLLVSSFGCAAETADIEFEWTRRHSIDKGTHLGRHLIQAFEPGEVTPEEAPRYIAGFAAGNDFSARDMQFASSQWTLGKACDGFAPVGPFFVSRDEVNPNKLDISCKVNGEYVQKSNTSKMIFSCAEIVSYLSDFIRLKKGDLIFTGTPSGVILGKEKSQQVWLKAGDVVTVEIEGLGTLENKLV